jgi:uncharacterized protein (TIGR03067 family)
MTPSVLIGLALAVGAPAPKETPKETPKLEGEWVVEKFEGPKEDQPPGSITMTITADRILIKEAKRDKPEEAGYIADLKKKPATIDIRPGRPGGAGAPPKEMVVQGILEINGDTLKLCFTRDGAERPTEFKGDAEKGVMLIFLKRVKAEK